MRLPTQRLIMAFIWPIFPAFILRLLWGLGSSGEELRLDAQFEVAAVYCTVVTVLLAPVTAYALWRHNNGTALYIFWVPYLILGVLIVGEVSNLMGPVHETWLLLIDHAWGHEWPRLLIIYSILMPLSFSLVDGSLRRQLNIGLSFLPRSPFLATTIGLLVLVLVFALLSALVKLLFT